MILSETAQKAACLSPSARLKRAQRAYKPLQWQSLQRPFHRYARKT
nr:MAG TPA: hypothetical protein [Caudoviricetes sp.]